MSSTITGYGFQKADLSTSTNNAIYGYKAGLNITTNSSDNVLIGAFAGRKLTTNSSSNIFIGSNVGINTTSASSSVIIGQDAGLNMVSGDGNTIVGRLAAGQGTIGLTGNANTILGGQAGAHLTGGAAQNTMVGTGAGFSATTGSNTFIGTSAGAGIITGTGNVMIGVQSGLSLGDVTYRYIVEQAPLRLIDGNFLTGAITTGGVTNQAGAISGATTITHSSYDDLGQIATPATPAAGYGRLYAATDGSAHFINDAGTNYNLTSPSTTTIETLAANGAISPTISNTILTGSGNLTMTLANATIEVQKTITSILSTTAVITLANGTTIKVAANQSITLIYDTGTSAWFVVGGNGESFLNQAQTGTFNSTQFSWGIALSGDGNTFAVGDGSLGASSLAIWTRSGTTWNLQQFGIEPSDEAIAFNSRFGYSVKLSYDGNTVVVGGPEDNFIGATWVFTRSGGVWTQQGSKLVGTGYAVQPRQGTSVSISDDGNTIAIGGPADNTNVGAVWVFTRSAGVWTQEGSKLVGTGGTPPSSQGDIVVLSGDSNTLAVGAANDNSFVGAVWVYTRSGGVWTQQAGPLIPADFIGYTTTTGRGSGIALDYTGDNMLFDASLNSAPSYIGVWFYNRANGLWNIIQDYVIPNSNVSSVPGNDADLHIGMNASATIAIIGNSDATSTVGVGYALTRINNQWALSNVLSDPTINITMGGDVAISKDGSTLAVGSTRSGYYTYIRV